MMLCLAICLWSVPDKSLSSRALSFSNNANESDKAMLIAGNFKKTLIQFFGILQSIFGNKPFVIFLSGFVLISIGVGMWYGLLFIYIDVYLGVGAVFAPTFVLAFAVGVISIPGWCTMAIRYDKNITLCVAVSLIICGFIVTGCFERGEANAVSLLTLQLIVAVGFACVIAMAPAMVSEAADYGAWKNNDNRPASYFAVYNFSHKTSSAVSAAAGLSIAGWYGFDVSSVEQSSSSVMGIKLTTAYLPACFAFLSLIFIYFTPINASRHQIIRRRLESIWVSDNTGLKKDL